MYKLYPGLLSVLKSLLVFFLWLNVIPLGTLWLEAWSPNNDFKDFSGAITNYFSCHLSDYSAQVGLALFGTCRCWRPWFAWLLWSKASLSVRAFRCYIYMVINLYKFIYSVFFFPCTYDFVPSNIWSVCFLIYSMVL